MAIQFTCPACGQPIEVDDEMANRAVTCPYCRKVGTAPATSTLDASATPPAADTVGTEAAGTLPYAGAAPTRKASPLGWISLGCVVVSILCLVYFTTAIGSMMQDLNPEPATPEEGKELQRIMQERMQSRPGLIIIGIAGACALPLTGVVCAIVTLARRSRPRWPAIVALSLVGAAILLSCAGIIMRGGMSPPGPGG